MSLGTGMEHRSALDRDKKRTLMFKNLPECVNHFKISGSDPRRRGSKP